MKSKYDFRDHLWEIFEGRRQRNSSYSLTAFARDLDLSASAMSLIMNRKRGLSLATANRIVIELGLTKSQQQKFILSVQSQFSKISKIREKSKESARKNQLARLAPTILKTQELPFELTWRHTALREFVSLPHFNPSTANLSRLLHVPEHVARSIWEQSLKAGLIIDEKDGTYTASEHINMVGSSQASVGSLKKMYKDLLMTIVKKVDDPRDERELAMVMLTLTEQQYAELKSIIKLFSSETSRNFKRADTNKKTFVACWSTQLFKV